mmetsp:Transcript_31797/g.44335  ORF Transcript_31797/g.44335 Transcript_31797/m.44335 type:complete len:157 (-) Transcript_31797:187-657(-)
MYGTEAFCRICLNGEGELLEDTCSCKGSIKWVHQQCLKKWIYFKRKDTCEICHAIYRNIEFSIPRNRPRTNNGRRTDSCIRTQIVRKTLASVTLHTALMTICCILAIFLEMKDSRRGLIEVLNKIPGNGLICALSVILGMNIVAIFKVLVNHSSIR